MEIVHDESEGSYLGALQAERVGTVGFVEDLLKETAPKVVIPRFFSEDAEELQAKGWVILPIERYSLNDLEGNGCALNVPYYVRRGAPASLVEHAVATEVAFNPRDIFLNNRVGRPLIEQKEGLQEWFREEFGEGPRDFYPGVLSAAGYAQVLLRYYRETLQTTGKGINLTAGTYFVLKTETPTSDGRYMNIRLNGPDKIGVDEDTDLNPSNPFILLGKFVFPSLCQNSARALRSLEEALGIQIIRTP